METTLQITGMTCDACVRHVSLALAAVPGADAVSVDLASGSARITGSAELEALITAITAITDSGYQAQPQQPGSTTPKASGCGCGASGGCGSKS